MNSFQVLKVILVLTHYNWSRGLLFILVILLWLYKYDPVIFSFFEFSPALFKSIFKYILLFLWSLLASFCEPIIRGRWVFQELMLGIRGPSGAFLFKELNTIGLSQSRCRVYPHTYSLTYTLQLYSVYMYICGYACVSSENMWY